MRDTASRISDLGLFACLRGGGGSDGGNNTAFGRAFAFNTRGGGGGDAYESTASTASEKQRHSRNVVSNIATRPATLVEQRGMYAQGPAYTSYPAQSQRNLHGRVRGDAARTIHTSAFSAPACDVKRGTYTAAVCNVLDNSSRVARDVRATRGSFQRCERGVYHSVQRGERSPPGRCQHDGARAVHASSSNASRATHGSAFSSRGRDGERGA